MLQRGHYHNMEDELYFVQGVIDAQRDYQAQHAPRWCDHSAFNWQHSHPCWRLGYFRGYQFLRKPTCRPRES